MTSGALSTTIGICSRVSSCWFDLPYLHQVADTQPSSGSDQCLSWMFFLMELQIHLSIFRGSSGQLMISTGGALPYVLNAKHSDYSLVGRRGASTNTHSSSRVLDL